MTSIDLCSAPYNKRPGDDVTDALQAAVNALAAGGGGEVFFSRSGVYTMDGPQQTGTVLGHDYSGQVLLPTGTLVSPLAIRIRGAQPPFQGGSVHLSRGTVLQSSATSGWMFDCIPGFNQFGAVHPWTNMLLQFEDIVLMAPDDPQCGAINAITCHAFAARRLVVRTDVNDSSASFYNGYTRTGALEAISLPQNLNDGNIYLEDCVVRNWKKGIRITEHVYFNNVRISFCESAMVTNHPGGHYNTGTLNVENCLNVFEYDAASSTGTCFLDMSVDWEGQQGGDNLFVCADKQSFRGSLRLAQGGGQVGSVPVDLGGTGLAKMLEKVDIASLIRPGSGWMTTYPSDNFARTVTPLDRPGLCYPSYHPWFLHEGSVEIVTAGATGAMRSTNGGGDTVAAVQSMKVGRSRQVSARFVLGASYDCGLVIGLVEAGSNINKHIRVRLTGGRLYVVGHLSGVTTPYSNGVSVTVGSTYTLSATVITNPDGVATQLVGYLNGVKQFTFPLPASFLAELSIVNGGTVPSPFELSFFDGVFFGETVSTVTRFWVDEPSLPVAALTAAKVTLVAGAASVVDTRITGNSIIRLTRQAAGGTLGELSVVMTSGTGFAINSASATDTSSVYYEIVSY